jgi:hypothetical protein
MTSLGFVLWDSPNCLSAHAHADIHSLIERFRHLSTKFAKHYIQSRNCKIRALTLGARTVNVVYLSLF